MKEAMNGEEKELIMALRSLVPKFIGFRKTENGLIAMGTNSSMKELQKSLDILKSVKKIQIEKKHGTEAIITTDNKERVV